MNKKTHSFARARVGLMTMVLATLGAGCLDEPDVQLTLPASLRLTELPAERQALLRATLEAKGLLATTDLAFDDKFTSVAGSFVVAVEKAQEVALTLRVFGRLNEGSAEVLLGTATTTATFRPRETTNLVFASDDWRVSGAAIFDPNGNGAPSVDDLAAGFEPAAPGPVVHVSPSEVQFPADLVPGSQVRQLVLVENASPLVQELNVVVVGAQGVSVVRVDATGTPAYGVPRETGPLLLQPFEEQLFAVTFAPTNTYVTRGALAFLTRHLESGVTTTHTIPVLGNADGALQPVADDYDVGVVDPSTLGFSGPILPYPPPLLFAGQSLVPGPVDLTLPGAAVVDIEPLPYPVGDIGEQPVSAAFLVSIPARARLSVELSGLRENVDLGLWLLDGDAVSTAEGDQLASSNGGTSAEVVQFRNVAAVARRALIVVTRVDEREVPGEDGASDERGATFTLLAQLNIGPELADVDPITPLRGAFSGGTAITIRGIGFEPGARVRFGDHTSDATQTEVNADSTTLTTVAPAASASDVGVALSVVVQNPDGAAATHPPAFLYDAPAPLVQQLDPPSANEQGGAPITITGSFFRDHAGGPRVRFDDVEAVVTFVSSNELLVVAPPHAPGLVNVVVRNVDEQGQETPSVAAAFLYTENVGDPPVVISISQGSGSGYGGDVLTITGSGFTPTSTIRLGGTVADEVTFVSDGTLTCVTPARLQGGTVDVVVQNADGRFFVLPGAFNYVTPAPELLSPSTTTLALAGGTRISLDGRNFFAGLQAELRQGGVVFPASAIVVSLSRLLVTSPAGLAPGEASLIVRNTDGQESNALALTVVAPVNPAPRILTLSPQAVRLDLLRTVVAAGTGFDAGLTLFVDEDIVEARDVTPTSFSFVPPERLSPGPAFVRVINEDGQSVTAAFSYEAAAAPVLFSVTPDVVGALIPGDVIVVTGANLVGTTPVVTDDTGRTFATTTTAATATAFTLRLDEPLPEGELYRVTLDGFEVSSPSFAAVEPTVSGFAVVAGQPAEGQALSLFVQGAQLNKERLSVVRLTQERDVEEDLVVDVVPSVKTSSFARIDVPAPGLAQGAWSLALVYSFDVTVGGTSVTETLVKEAPGRLLISGNCGNGVLEEGEECDGTALGGWACEDVGFFGGELRCSAQCVLDSRRCDRCGDGIIDVDLGEECDGANQGEATCADVIAGSTSGAPGCDARCQRTAGTCATCGNGIAEGDEQCDGTDLGTATCATLGFNAGRLSCDEECRFSGDLCSTCGNNRCDVLETNANCAADCAPTCGNSICEEAERCTTCPRDCGGQCVGPYSVRLVSGSGQSAAFSSAFSEPFVVEARAEGNDAPLVGVQVTFAGPPGSDVTPVRVLTDANGRAQTLATLPRTLGTSTWTATATDPEGTLLVGAPLSWTTTTTDIAPGTITTIANRGALPAGRSDTSSGGIAAAVARLNLDNDGASGMAERPSDGAIFVSDTYNHRIVVIAADGTLTTAVGPQDGSPGFVDNIEAPRARLNRPTGLAFDPDGNLFIADTDNQRVRKLDAVTGMVTTVAGGGAQTNENVLATNFNLGHPSGLVVDRNGSLLVQSRGYQGAGALRRIDRNGVISTVVAARGTACGSTEPAVYGFWDTQLALDAAGRPLFFADVYGGTSCPLGGVFRRYLLRVEDDGTLSSLAGNGTVAEPGAARTSALNETRGLVTDTAGNIYFSERNSESLTVRRISPLGMVSVVAGQAGLRATALDKGDGGPARAARLGNPGFLLLSSAGDLWMTDQGLSSVRLVRGMAETSIPRAQVELTGSGQQAPILQPAANPLAVRVAENGAGVPGVLVRVVAPPGAAVEPSSGITDVNGVFSTLAFVGRKPGAYAFVIQLLGIDGGPLPLENLASGEQLVATVTATDMPQGALTSLVNQRGTAGSFLATNAPRSFTYISSASESGVVVDQRTGTLYLSDTENHRVLRMSPEGAISVVAGTGVAGNGGNGPALSVPLYRPKGLALDDDGRLYIADFENDVVRVLDTDGSLRIFAGGPRDQSDPADGVVATGAALNGPVGLAIGPHDAEGNVIDGVTGNLFILEELRNRIRKVDITTPGVPGTITSVVVGSQACNSTNGILSDDLFGFLAFDRSGRLYFTGTLYNIGGCPAGPSAEGVFRLDHDGKLAFLVGGPNDGAAGPAYGTLLRRPTGLAVDKAGNLFVAESYGHRIRRIDTLGSMTTVVGDGISGHNGEQNDATNGRVSYPFGLSFDDDDNLYFVDGNNNRLRMVRGIGRTTPIHATMAIAGGDGQATVMGQMAALPMQVKLLDDNQEPVVNLPLRFTALDPGDKVTQPEVMTTPTGEANTTIRLGRNTDEVHEVVVEAYTWLDPSPILGDDGEPVVFALEATRPPSGASVALVNSQGTYGRVPPVGVLSAIPATQARLYVTSASFALAEDGTLYIPDGYNSRILKVGPRGELVGFAGTGASGYTDNRPARDALLGDVRGAAIDDVGNVYFSELSTVGGGRVRRVDPSGLVTTIAGGAVDTPGHGDGGGGSGVYLSQPTTLSIGPDGALYVVDIGLNNIRRIQLSSPFLTTSFVGDGGNGCSAAAGLRHYDLTFTGLAWDDDDRLYFFAVSGPDQGGCVVPSYTMVLVRREANGALTYIAGGGNNEDNAVDGKTAKNLALGDPSGLVIDGDSVVFADTTRHRLRRLTGILGVAAGSDQGASGTVTTLLGTMGSPGFASFTAPGEGRLHTPRGLVKDPIRGDFYWLEDSTTSSLRMFVP
jgi:sugar lactone lactonase YvrE